jgi:hypothetical protein
MEIQYIKNGNSSIAQVSSDVIIIRTIQDALDLMANCQYNGAEKIILDERNITPEFFDLRTRLAGDILQKFSNYRVQLAIVGDFSKYASKSLHDFIYESNKQKHIIFVESIDQALEFFSKY